jgi:hypothetical protein
LPWAADSLFQILGQLLLDIKEALPQGVYFNFAALPSFSKLSGGE